TEALCRGDDVWLDLPVLDAEPLLPGAPPARLHFIGDEISAVLLHDVECDLEIFLWRRNKASNALDRLGDHAGDTAAGRSLDDLLDIARASNVTTRICELEWAAVAVRVHRVNDADLDGGATPTVHARETARE